MSITRTARAVTHMNKPWYIVNPRGGVCSVENLMEQNVHTHLPLHLREWTLVARAPS